MKKSNHIALACIMCTIAAVTLSFLTVANLNRHDSYGTADAHASDFPHLQGVTKNNGYYNISLAFTNVTDPIKLYNILINPQSNQTVTGSTFYLNGTALKETDPVSCNLNSGDSLQINLTLPCTEFPSGQTITLYVMGDCFGCGKAVVLP